MKCALKLIVACVACAIVMGCTSATDRPHVPELATIGEIKSFFASQGKFVLTFVGYSGAGYESPDQVLVEAASILDAHSPETTIVNIGATADGVGSIYELAKERGFATSGIVSTQARDNGVPVAPSVDYVFYVRDASWGGLDATTGRLSPTSQAMVEVSSEIVGIGGGDVARDEMSAARRAQKRVVYIPADMNHEKAIQAARSKGLPVPTDFRGSAGMAGQ